MGAGTLKTNLIIHHGITDVFCQATKPIHILSAIQESHVLPTCCQQDQVTEDNLQFSGSSHMLDQFLVMRRLRLLFECFSSPLFPDLALRNRLAK